VDLVNQLGRRLGLGNRRIAAFAEQPLLAVVGWLDVPAFGNSRHIGFDFDSGRLLLAGFFHQSIADNRISFSVCGGSGKLSSSA